MFTEDIIIIDRYCFCMDFVFYNAKLNAWYWSTSELNIIILLPLTISIYAVKPKLKKRFSLLLIAFINSGELYLFVYWMLIPVGLYLCLYSLPLPAKKNKYFIHMVLLPTITDWSKCATSIRNIALLFTNEFKINNITHSITILTDNYFTEWECDLNKITSASGII